MATTNERLRDRSVSHAIGLERLKAGVVRRIIALLNRVDADLVRQINQRLDDLGLLAFTSDTQGRLNAMLRGVRSINREAFVAVGEALTAELEDLASYEPDFQTRMLLDELPVRWDLKRVSAEQLQAIVQAQPFRGRLLREWVDTLEGAQFGRIRDAIRIGMVEGETIDQIVRRIRGTRASAFRDGILDISRREAAAVVRTAVNHVATRGREELYRANQDVMAGVQWVSTLDSRTTVICASRDGNVYPVGEGPRPPAHFACRSTTAPITKSWRELGIDLDDAPPGTRASQDGQVPATTTYDDWLRRQPRAVQDDVLGPTRAELFRSGDLPLSRMVRADGTEYTLAELSRRETGVARRPNVWSRTEQSVALTEVLGQDGYERVLESATRRVADSGLDVSRMTEPQLAALHGYTGSLYNPVNLALRSGESRQYDPIAAAVSEALDALPAWSGPVDRITTLPGSVVSSMTVGSIFREQAFLSTARFRSDFSGAHRIVLYSRSGRRIDGLSRFAEEREVLFQPRTAFRVIWRGEDEDGRTMIVLREIEEGRWPTN